MEPLRHGRPMAKCHLWLVATGQIAQRLVGEDTKEGNQATFIIWCDFHTHFRQIAMVNPTPSEITERPRTQVAGEERAG